MPFPGRVGGGAIKRPLACTREWGLEVFLALGDADFSAGRLASRGGWSCTAVAVAPLGGLTTASASSPRHLNLFVRLNFAILLYWKATVTFELLINRYRS